MRPVIGRMTNTTDPVWHALGLPAAALGERRNGARQQVRIDMRLAALECAGRFEIEGRVPELWDKIAGLSACGGDRRWGAPARAAGSPSRRRWPCRYSTWRPAS